MSKVLKICVESVEELRGRRVVLETDTGHVRHGTVTEIPSRPVIIYGHEHHFPVELVIDGERSDAIPWAHVKSIAVAE